MMVGRSLRRQIAHFSCIDCERVLAGERAVVLEMELLWGWWARYIARGARA